MSSSRALYPAAGEGRFGCTDAAADGTTAGRVREDFARWLRRSVDLDETRLCDVLLAVNEALANVAEFAYLNQDRAGTFDVEAVLDPRRSALTVTVSDRGRWRHTEAAGRLRSRGRGIPLMRALADGFVIDSSPLGTSVCLRFDNAAALRTDVPVG